MAGLLSSSTSSQSALSSQVRKLDLDQLPRMSRKLALECAACHRTARYEVGTIMISPKAFEDRGGKRLPEEYIGFTGYVRCKECDAGGPWLFPAMTMRQILALVMLKLDGRDDVPVEVGEMQTFDGLTVRYATQSEEHLQQLIKQEPSRGFLWTRLGNVYRHAELPKLAEPAYRRALELDPSDFEAHASLAQVLAWLKHPREAIPHWQFVLALAHSAAQTPRELRRNCVRSAVEAILNATHEQGEEVPFYPPGHEPFRDRPREEPVILELRDFDLSKERDMEDFCDGFLGERRASRVSRLPRRLQALVKPDDRLPQEPPRQTVGRNTPCPCGSGRKYKKCCGRADR